jgi:GrpB-like predicted nucleotidyltransferase (UPF0157 family)
METHEEKLARVLRDPVRIAPYDPAWPVQYRTEAVHLRACLPAFLVGRIEHFGSTAVPGLAAKPIVDMLIEVRDLEATRRLVPPILEPQGYDYFWRPTHGDDGPPFYCWFIKRDAATGARTHHLHLVEPGFTMHWDRLRFRDRLIADPDLAADYAALKRDLARRFPDDRAAYTAGKSAFIARGMARDPGESA